jgi:1-acyl-sn-glycerol-3-phosphate acyltransferase
MGMEQRGKFDGYLTAHELEHLKMAGFSQKEINVIEELVFQNREHLTGLVDFTGDKDAPSKLFLRNLKHYGRLLDDNPQNVITKRGVLLRKWIIGRMIQKVGPLALKNKQIFESKSELVGKTVEEKVKLPKTPVLYVPNHHFKDDALASVIAAERPAYLLFGSMPQFYNTTDGILANAIGSLMINRKVVSSKHAVIKKAIYAYELGADVLCFPEGVHNKYPNELLLPLWSGIYQIAVETGEPVVPIVHYIYDPTIQIDSKLNPIHTVVDQPIYIGDMGEKAALNHLRDVMATWYYLMMERYGKTTREELMDFYYEQYKKRADELGIKILPREIFSSHDAFETYLYDLTRTVDWYDSEIETCYDYRPKELIRPESVFENIANLGNHNICDRRNILEAQLEVRIRRLEDYQRRF